MLLIVLSIRVHALHSTEQIACHLVYHVLVLLLLPDFESIYSAATQQVHHKLLRVYLQVTDIPGPSAQSEHVVALFESIDVSIGHTFSNE